MKIVNMEADIDCNSSDNTYKIVMPDQVTIDENGVLTVKLYSGSGTGGYRNRYTRVTQRVIDENVQEALIECNFASFYRGQIRAGSLKKFIVGKDDGATFVTQVKKTVQTLGQAFDSITPKAARVPGQSGREISGWSQRRRRR